LQPTRCLVLRPFYVGGRRVKVDAEVTLPKHDALSMRALGKVKILT
jgi:hypothetical protein